MQESVVIDGLAPLTIDDRWVAWSQTPETFTEAHWARVLGG